MLRFQRVTTRGIAERLGVSKSTVDDDIVALRAAWKARYADRCAEWIEDETAEVEHYESELYRQWQESVAAGEPNERMLEVALRWKNRKHTLRGLDKPLKVAPTMPDGDEPWHGLSDEQLERQIRKLATDE